MELTKTTKQNQNESIFSTKKKRVTMGIDSTNSVHITKLLTDLYKNPIEATVRELISNAIDTTMKLPEADRKEIIVTLPTEMGPNFIVQDFGEGMSRDTLETIYSQYGASTKGDDFSQIGAFGLGAKAPLSYASKFSVESTKDGVTTEVFLTSSDEGNFCDIVTSEETGKPNGTIVTIPVTEGDFYDFRRSVDSYRKFSFGVKIKFIGIGMDTTYSNVEITKVGKIPVSELNGETIYCNLFAYDEEYRFNEGLTSDEMDYLTLIRQYGDISNRDAVTSYVSYLLSGWSYSNPEYSYGKKRLFVELIPGIVNFSSSRDEITENARYKEFADILNENIPALFKGKLKELEEKLDLTPVKKLQLLVRAGMTLPYNSVQKGMEDASSLLQGLHDNNDPSDYDTELTFDYLYTRSTFGSKVGILEFSSYSSSLVRRTKSSISQALDEINKMKQKTTLNEFDLFNVRLDNQSPNKYVIISDVKDAEDTVKKVNRYFKRYAQFIGATTVSIGLTENTEQEVLDTYKDFKLGDKLIVLDVDTYIDNAKTIKIEKSSTTKNSLSDDYIQCYAEGDLKKGDRRWASEWNVTRKKPSKLKFNNKLKTIGIIGPVKSELYDYYVLSEATALLSALLLKYDIDEYNLIYLSKTNLKAANVEEIMSAADYWIGARSYIGTGAKVIRETEANVIKKDDLKVTMKKDFSLFLVKSPMSSHNYSDFDQDTLDCFDVNKDSQLYKLIKEYEYESNSGNSLVENPFESLYAEDDFYDLKTKLEIEFRSFYRAFGYLHKANKDEGEYKYIKPGVDLLEKAIEDIIVNSETYKAFNEE